MTEKQALRDLRINLIARHTQDAEVAVRANLVTACKSLQRTINGIDVLLESACCGDDLCDLTHLRARLITAGEILMQELEDIALV